MFEQNNILGVFVGHNHYDDYLIDYYGMILAFGRKTGVSGNGPLYNNI